MSIDALTAGPATYPSVYRRRASASMRPFLVAAAVVIAVGLFPYQPEHPMLTLAGLAGIVLTGIANYRLPWRKWPRPLLMIPTAAMVVACGLILGGQGSVDLSLLPLFLLLAVWAATYGLPLESALVVALSAFSIFIVGMMFDKVEASEIIQPLVTWSTATCLVVVSVRHFRSEIERRDKVRDSVGRHAPHARNAELR